MKDFQKNIECLYELIRVGTDLELKNEERFSFMKFLEDEKYTNNGKFRKKYLLRHKICESINVHRHSMVCSH